MSPSALCRAVLAEHYFLGDFDNIYELALMLRHLRLTLREHYLFSISPTDASDPPVASALLSFATAYSSRCSLPNRSSSRPLDCTDGRSILFVPIPD